MSSVYELICFWCFELETGNVNPLMHKVAKMVTYRIMGFGAILA